MALRVIMKAKVSAGNVIHQLDTIDCFTDDWDDPTGSLTSPALDIHLQCQYSAEECKSIIEILDGFLANPALSQQVGIFSELEVRRENAVDEVKKLVVVLAGLKELHSDPALSLREMWKRAERLVGKIEGLRGNVEELETMVRAPMLQQQEQPQTPQQQQQV
ncbi:hypothetical protein LTR08_000364 [Meristemomyces frigidus]|nr:hypothetical protein LTR08_000364 [Meristemomyces frigidus]